MLERLGGSEGLVWFLVASWSVSSGLRCPGPCSPLSSFPPPYFLSLFRFTNFLLLASSTSPTGTAQPPASISWLGRSITLLRKSRTPTTPFSGGTAGSTTLAVLSTILFGAFWCCLGCLVWVWLVCACLDLCLWFLLGFVLVWGFALGLSGLCLIFD